MLQNITVIGSGSWATALVKVFAESGLGVNWLVRNKEQAEYIRINGKNPRYLCSADLDAGFIHPTADILEAVADTPLIIFAVPSAYLKESVEKIDKGILCNKNLLFL